MLNNLINAAINTVVAIKCAPSIIELRVSQQRNNIAINKLKEEYEFELMKKELGLGE